MARSNPADKSGNAASEPATSAVTELKFEAALAELEQIASWFEEGEPDLDEGMKRYERASELAKELKAKLDEAENRIKEIKNSSAKRYFF